MLLLSSSLGYKCMFLSTIYWCYLGLIQWKRSEKVTFTLLITPREPRHKKYLKSKFLDLPHLLLWPWACPFTSGLSCYWSCTTAQALVTIHRGVGCHLSQIMLLTGPFLEPFPVAGSDQQPASVALHCQVAPQQWASKAGAEPAPFPCQGLQYS